MFYQVPTPNELFAVLKNAEVAYNRENLNDISNVNKYETKASKALNFGVYTADLAYITSLGQMDDASKFFETIRNLSKDLEIDMFLRLSGIKIERGKILNNYFHYRIFYLYLNI